MASRRLDRLENLPALARARQRRAFAAGPRAVPQLPAIVTPAQAAPAAVPEEPKPRPSRTPDSLTVCKRFRPQESARAGGRHVPYLRLSGRWLEERGFTIGSNVVVQVADGRVILTNAAAAAVPRS